MTIYNFLLFRFFYSSEQGTATVSYEELNITSSMAGGPLLQLWENLLPFAKDLRIRFALAMLGNVLAILFIFSLSKMFIPGLEDQLFN